MDIIIFLFARRRFGSSAIHSVPSEDFDQTVQMRGLIKVFAGHEILYPSYCYDRTQIKDNSLFIPLSVSVTNFQ